MKVVLEAKAGFEKIDCAASGSTDSRFGLAFLIKVEEVADGYHRC